jgi:DNA ligase-1
MLFRELSEYYSKIEDTSGRLEMMAVLAEAFSKASAGEIEKIIYVSQGVVAPPFLGIETGMGERFAIQAVALASGYDARSVEREFKKSGDLGLAAEKLLSERRQQSLHSERLTVLRVFDSFVKLSKTSGSGSQEKKIGMLAELLNSASPLEARYITRFVTGALRLGAGESTILEALSIAKLGDRSGKGALERAYNLCSDLGLVGQTLYSEGMEGIGRFRTKLFHPVRPALAERLASAEEIFAKLGRCGVDAKYDGLRMQVHKKGSEVQIYSRRLELITPMFPEIVEAARAQVSHGEAIFEGEALAVNEEAGEFYPFQTTMQRKRVHGVREKAEEFPLKLFAFDMLHADGEDCTRKPYSERRKLLEKSVRQKKGSRIEPSALIIAESAEQVKKYFEECIEKGLEGVIAKDLSAPYVAGARKFAWIKLKRSYKGELADSIDVVIVGYYLGKGKRTEFGFGGFLGAVYDSREERFKTVTKVGTGFSEEQMGALKKALDTAKSGEKPSDVDSDLVPDVWVRPRFVVTLTADEITRSPTHTAGRDAGGSGYALRFPRLKGNIREDKAPEDATTVKEIVEMYGLQKRTQLPE